MANWRAGAARDGFAVWDWSRAPSGGGGIIQAFPSFGLSLNGAVALNATRLTVEGSSDAETLQALEAIQELGYGRLAIGARISPAQYDIESVDPAAGTITLGSGLTVAEDDGEDVYISPLMEDGATLAIPGGPHDSLEVRATGRRFGTSGPEFATMTTGGFQAPATAWYKTLGAGTVWYADTAVDLNEAAANKYIIGVVHLSNRSPMAVYGLYYNAETSELELTIVVQAPRPPGYYTTVDSIIVEA